MTNCWHIIVTSCHRERDQSEIHKTTNDRQTNM